MIRPRPPLRNLSLALLTALIAYLALTGLQVWRTAQRDERAPAEAIVVLGAAQYDGSPSPVLRARLEHGLALWRQDVAGLIAVTGGGRPGDRVTEADAGAAYLYAHGVPDAAVLRENYRPNHSTWESLASTARALKRRGLRRVVLVSDPTHALRTANIARDLGLEPQVSPTRTLAHSPRTSLRQGLRETLAVAAGRLVGHRRLAKLVQRLEAPAATSAPQT